MLSGIVIEFRALFLDDDPVLGLITGFAVIAVFVCNVLEYRKRMQSRDYVFQACTDETRMLKDTHDTRTNRDVRCSTCGMAECRKFVNPAHALNLLPVHNCTCDFCQEKRYDEFPDDDY